KRSRISVTTEFKKMKKEDKILSLLENMISQLDSYHNHKENNAHIGLAIQISLFSGIMTLGEKLAITDSNLILVVISLVGIWSLLHFFIRNQLRLKRAAAIFYSGYLNAFLEFVNQDFNKLSLAPKKIQRLPKNGFLLFLDYIIPVNRAPLNTSIEKNINPKFIRDQLQVKYDLAQVNSNRNEWVFAIASILMFVVMIVRTFTL
ncbi:MAG: hypothetical protein AB3N14_05430, partial [Flavobacteriaceae bacterium]